MKDKRTRFVEGLCEQLSIKTLENREKVATLISEYVDPILEDREMIFARLNWLEDAVDNANLSKILIEYQKTFDVNYWSGSS